MTTITATAAATAAGAGETATAKLNADFTMFLKMLTTQMQNQDPLDPMETSEYTQQLVQYSQVEQSIAQNGTLKEILSSLGGQSLTQASLLIGREVVTDSAESGLSDQPAHWKWSTTRDAASLTAEIVDASGRTVATETLDGGTAKGDITWDGLLDNGNTAPEGVYTLRLTAKDASGTDLPVKIQSAGVPSGVEMVNGSVQLIVNGMHLPLSVISSINV